MKYDLSGGVSRSAGRVFSAFREALFSLLQRQSFESITVQTLCNAADYPRSTFYNYFDDIYDLLDFCLQTPIRGFDRDKYAPVSAAERVYAVFSDLYDMIDARSEEFSRVFRTNKPTGVLQSSISKRLRQDVFTALTDAAPERDVLPREMLAEHCCDAIHLLLSWCFLRREPRLGTKEAAMEALRYLIGGLYRGETAAGGAAQ